MKQQINLNLTTLTFELKTSHKILRPFNPRKSSFHPQKSQIEIK